MKRLVQVEAIFFEFGLKDKELHRVLRILLSRVELRLCMHKQ